MGLGPLGLRPILFFSFEVPQHWGGLMTSTVESMPPLAIETNLRGVVRLLGLSTVLPRMGGISSIGDNNAELFPCGSPYSATAQRRETFPPRASGRKDGGRIGNHR